MPADDGIAAEESTSFGLSVGDLMAALLLVFILLLGATLLLLKEQEQKTVETISDYQALKDSLYADLKREFAGDLDRWNATIDSTTLVVRFQEPDVLFEYGESDVRPRFKDILDSFFPRYLSILTRREYKSSIQEIRVEGHTSQFWSDEATAEEAYFENMRLSQDRTRSVLRYALGTLRSQDSLVVRNTQNRVRQQPKDLIDWTRQHLTANGLSSSRPVLRSGERDAEASRRVEFRVRTDAEDRMREIIERIASR